MLGNGSWKHLWLLSFFFLLLGFLGFLYSGLVSPPQLFSSHSSVVVLIQQINQPWGRRGGKTLEFWSLLLNSKWKMILSNRMIVFLSTRWGFLNKTLYTSLLFFLACIRFVEQTWRFPICPIHDFFYILVRHIIPAARNIWSSANVGMFSLLTGQ